MDPSQAIENQYLPVSFVPQQRHDSFRKIPTELLLMMFSSISGSDAVAASKVSKGFETAAVDRRPAVADSVRGFLDYVCKEKTLTWADGGITVAKESVPLAPIIVRFFDTLREARVKDWAEMDQSRMSLIFDELCNEVCSPSIGRGGSYFTVQGSSADSLVTFGAAMRSLDLLGEKEAFFQWKRLVSALKCDWMTHNSHEQLAGATLFAIDGWLKLSSSHRIEGYALFGDVISNLIDRCSRMHGSHDCGLLAVSGIVALALEHIQDENLFKQQEDRLQALIGLNQKIFESAKDRLAGLSLVDESLMWIVRDLVRIASTTLCKVALRPHEMNALDPEDRDLAKARIDQYKSDLFKQAEGVLRRDRDRQSFAQFLNDDHLQRRHLGELEGNVALFVMDMNERNAPLFSYSHAKMRAEEVLNRFFDYLTEGPASRVLHAQRERQNAGMRHGIRVGG
jgi:hypothetical protein